MLYGVQTVNQLAIQARRSRRDGLSCLEIRDWPDVKWRCLAQALTWYSGFNRLEGYDLNNWSPDEWKWLVDWSLLHKCNAWAVCMCGYWPFTLPEYPESMLDVASNFFNPLTGKKESRRFVHPNIKQEFYPEVIRYVDRGIKMYAYTAINSFVGGYCCTIRTLRRAGQRNSCLSIREWIATSTLSWAAWSRWVSTVSCGKTRRPTTCPTKMPIATGLFGSLGRKPTATLRPPERIRMPPRWAYMLNT